MRPSLQLSFSLSLKRDIILTKHDIVDKFDTLFLGKVIYVCRNTRVQKIVNSETNWVTKIIFLNRTSST